MGLKKGRPFVATKAYGGGPLFGFTVPDPFDTEPAKIEHWMSLDETLQGKPIINQIFYEGSYVGMRASKHQNSQGVRAVKGTRSRIIARRIKAHNERIRKEMT